MGELTVEMLITVDGYGSGEGEAGYFGFPGPELEAWIDEQLEPDQTFIMGRVSYELMASIVKDQEVEGGERMNELPKVVFSSKLQEPLEWKNTTVASGELEEEIAKLKDGDRRVRSMGSPTLVRSLLVAGLVDRLQLLVFPKLLDATGQDPIFRGLPNIDLELLSERVLDGRIIVLEYRPTLAA